VNFDFSDDQREIKRTARGLLAARATPERVREAAEARTYDEGLWRELVELGWPGIAVVEQHGELHGAQALAAVLLEELGYAIAPSPMLATATAAVAIQTAGSDAQRERWLPRLASGEATGALGTEDLVADGDRADVIVLFDGCGEGRLLERGSVEVEPLETIDPTRAYARVSGDGEPLPGDVAAAVDRALVGVAAELVGVCQRALDTTLEYVKERRQFGVPVGAFQAVQHRCAQMLLYTESARSATYFAAWAADAEPDRLPEAASLAKAAASEAGRETTASAIQAHGGIGFTWEADVHWLYKRAQLDAQLLGGAGHHRARLTRIVASRLSASAS
jgi:alkylation response protein AidB-like acyl-CoA dehydrogenase